MTREEALRLVKGYLTDIIPMENYSEVEEIMEALESEPNWIPCSEGGVPEDEYVLISKKPSMLSGNKWCVGIGIRMADPRSGKIQWRDSGFDVIQDDKVLAWMPRPIPYKTESEIK